MDKIMSSPASSRLEPSEDMRELRKKANEASRRRQARKAEGLRPLIAFYIFFAAGLFAAFFSPIQDCDEVFNYWEPSHYLNHGYGLQTWEYSPVYAIRSWAYAGVHSIIIATSKVVPFVNNKSVEFYFLRIVFAFVWAATQGKLFSVMSRSMNPRIAIIFLIISITSPGMFHAATAYLPSTFAMYTTALGTAAFIRSNGIPLTAQGIVWFGVGATLGWPFAAVLVAPFMVEEFFAAFMANKLVSMLTRAVDGTVRSLVVLAIQAAVDILFYRKLVIVPLNIVLYNVFGGSGKGPDIYGTEPWHFYIRNLVLNFNIWFALALASIPLCILQYAVRGTSPTRQTTMRTITVTAPFYLWLAIFTIQPHKEERFMYPAYPLLVLNAAVSMHIILNYFGSNKPNELISKIPLQLRFAAITFVVLIAMNLGLLRIAGMLTAYSAPLKVYSPLQQPGFVKPGDNVCFGKEWYRFPSSYFLPDGVKAKFIRSEFKGLLPGEFSENKSGLGLYPGTWLEPEGMNDENLEDPGKYTQIDQCQYLVDSYFPGAAPSALEPDYILDTDRWETIKCVPYLDAGKTNMIGRTLWVPDHAIVPARFRRRWGQYCLLKRRDNSDKQSA